MTPTEGLSRRSKGSRPFASQRSDGTLHTVHRALRMAATFSEPDSASVTNAMAPIERRLACGGSLDNVRPDE
jgi:hypothetical protein